MTVDTETLYFEDLIFPNYTLIMVIPKIVIVRQDGLHLQITK